MTVRIDLAKRMRVTSSGESAPPRETVSSAAFPPPEGLPAAPSEVTKPRRGAGVLQRARSEWPTAVAGIVLLLIVLAAIHPAIFTSQSATTGVTANRLQSPSAAHWFGTDELGRDLYARTVYGSRLSIGCAGLAVAIALVVGSLVGLVAGFVGGFTGSILMRIADICLSIPGLLLSLALVTALGFSALHVAVAVGLPGAASFARLMRARVLQVAAAEYVEAALACGVRRVRVMVAHVLPNALGPVLAFSVLEFGSAVMGIAALSFLGFGAQPPTPEWGSLIANGRDYLATAWWIPTLPGLVLIATIVAANRIAYSFGSREIAR